MGDYGACRAAISVGELEYASSFETILNIPSNDENQMHLADVLMPSRQETTVPQEYDL